MTGTSSTFAVANNPGSIYNWTIDGLGFIASGQYSNEIMVDWSILEGVSTICVNETYDCSDFNCVGDTACIEVEIKSPSNISENNFDINIYPNPSSDMFNLEFFTLKIKLKY